MFNFKTYLNESKSVDQTSAQRTHLEHGPDRVFDGHEGVAEVDDHNRKFARFLSGDKKSGLYVSRKIDGAPAVHVIKNEDGTYSVATKGLFNKDPKKYSSEEEIDKEYGEKSPELGQILKQTLRHAHKTMPDNMKPGEIVKGDILFANGTQRGLQKGKGFVKAQPNLLGYKFPADSQEGRDAAAAQLGVVWHTKFDRKGQASAITPEERAQFKRSTDVFTMNPDVQPNAANFTPEERAEFENHMENARQTYGKIKPEAYDTLGGHSATLRTHINQTVPKGIVPTFDSYVDFLNARHQKDVDKVKTPAAKEKKVQAHGEMMQQLHGSRKDLEHILALHGHMERAKDVLGRVADKSRSYAVELPNGAATNDEGYVTTNKKTGSAQKVVNRPEFTIQNQQYGAIGQARAAAQQPVNESKEEEAGDHAAIVGGFAPFTTGHESVVNSAKAGKHKSVNVFTTQATKARGMPAERKAGYIQRAVGPDVNVGITKTPFHALSDMWASGKRGTVTLYGGSDRSGLAQQLHNYKGVEGRHGYHGFDVKFQQVGGERDSNASGLAGVSGSKARASKTPEELKQYLPKASHPEAQDIFNDMNTKLVKEETGYVPNEGNAAPMAELGARGAPTESGPKKKKPLKENSVGAVGGLGLNTGNPAASDSYIANYVDKSTADADTRDNILKGMIKANHTDLHAPLGFKAFDPKEFKAQQAAKKTK